MHLDRPSWLLAEREFVDGHFCRSILNRALFHPNEISVDKKRITSAQNSTFKNAMRLQTSRGRSKQGRIIVFGQREIERAANHVEVLELFVDASFFQHENGLSLIEKFGAANVYEIPSELFQKLAYGDRSDGIVAVAEVPNSTLADIEVKDDSLIVVVQGIEKPGNLGAIFRSADGAGVDSVVAVDTLTTPFHPNAIRSSLGTVFSIASALTETVTMQRWLKEHQFQVFCAHPDSAKSFSDVDFTGRTAIVLGNEAKGLSQDWLGGEFQNQSVKLPMLGIADSLNVSVCGAVLMYEARRQRMVGE